MQVVNFLPRALFINRVGTGIILSEYHTELEEHVCPTDPPKVFRWRSEFGNELLKVTTLNWCLLCISLLGFWSSLFYLPFLFCMLAVAVGRIQMEYTI
jgi:hypothetical protein